MDTTSVSLTQEEMFKGIYDALLHNDKVNFLDHRARGELPPTIGADFVVHPGEEINPFKFKDELRVYLEEKFASNPQMKPYLDGTYSMTYSVTEDSVSIRVQVRFDEGHTEVTYKPDDLELKHPIIRWVKTKVGEKI